MTEDPRTRARLLQAAEQLFGEKGFKKVTVREICRAARANVAAVNYHFGDKFGLYREVVQIAIDSMRMTSEIARSAGEGKKPEEKLRLYIGVFLSRVLDPGNVAIHRLITREMNEPTPALDALVEQGMRPRIEYLASVITEIIGCDPKDQRVLRCAGSIQSQAVTYMKSPISAKLGLSFAPTKANIDRAADHIATFSIGGVRAVRRMKPSP